MAKMMQLNGSFEGPPGKSAYEYAQDGGYTGSEEEFAEKLAKEYPTDVQINGQSIVENGVAEIPIVTNNKLGLCKPGTGMIIAGNGLMCFSTPIKDQINNRSPERVITNYVLDYAVKASMTDGKGAAWTDTEKSGAWSRLSSIKTTMDEVAVAGARYLLGELTELSVVLPDDALVGQEITVAWYNGDTASTLSITGNMLDFDYTPTANTRSEISCLWDSTYWSVIGMSQEVPSEVTVSE